jgi:hypothetical protein
MTVFSKMNIVNGKLYENPYSESGVFAGGRADVMKKIFISLELLFERSGKKKKKANLRGKVGGITDEKKL